MTETLERLVGGEGHLGLLNDVQLADEFFNVKFNSHNRQLAGPVTAP